MKNKIKKRLMSFLAFTFILCSFMILPLFAESILNNYDTEQIGGSNNGYYTAFQYDHTNHTWVENVGGGINYVIEKYSIPSHFIQPTQGAVNAYSIMIDWTDPERYNNIEDFNLYLIQYYNNAGEATERLIHINLTADSGSYNLRLYLCSNDTLTETIQANFTDENPCIFCVPFTGIIESTDTNATLRANSTFQALRKYFFQEGIQYARPQSFQILNNMQYTTSVDDETQYNNGYTAGVQTAQPEAYQAGYNDAMSIIDMPELGAELAFSIVETPVNVLMSILNFEIFGINLFWTFAGIVTILLVAAVIKRFLL